MPENQLATSPPPPQPTPPPAQPSAQDALMSVREAARTLAARRQELAQQATQQPEEEPREPAPEITAPEPSEPAAPVEEPQPSGETPELEPAEEQQPIEPPGSWTAEAKARFAELPPDLQAYVSERETQRDTEVRRRQQEVADYLRQLAPEQQAMMQARAQYEQALPAILQTLQASGEFSDIRTYQDVEKLAKEDWPRYVQYDAHQKKVAAVQQEMQQAQARQAQEYFSNWQNYAAEQDRMFAEKVPEFADPEKAEALQRQAINTLENEYGFSLGEMQAGWAGAFRDHRIQQLILDATRYRQLLRNKPKPVSNLPRVVRPGTARGPEAANEMGLKALDQKIDQTTGNKQLRVAAQLLHARRTQRS